MLNKQKLISKLLNIKITFSIIRNELILKSGSKPFNTCSKQGLHHFFKKSNLVLINGACFQVSTLHTSFFNLIQMHPYLFLCTLSALYVIAIELYHVQLYNGVNRVQSVEQLLVEVFSTALHRVSYVFIILKPLLEKWKGELLKSCKGITYIFRFSNSTIFFITKTCLCELNHYNPKSNVICNSLGPVQVSSF